MPTDPEETRRRLFNGMDALTHAVATTLGPQAGSVAVIIKSGGITLAYDGVTVARTMELEDPDEKRGVELLGQAAIKTDESVGDGTATAIVLAQAMVTAGWQRQADKADRKHLVQGIEKATKAVVETLGETKGRIETKEGLASVATTAAADTEIGTRIAGIINMVGINGLVVVEVSQECEFEVEYIEGMRIDGGVVSPGFITNSKTMEASLKNPNILIYKNKISAAADLVPLLEKLVQTRRHDLLVIAEDVEGEALAALLDYKARGLLNGLAIQAPASGSVRKAILEDIAVLTGGSLINSGLRGIDVSLLGGAEKVIVTKDYATVVGGRGKTQAIRGHIQEIQDEVDRATMNREEKKILLGRLAALAGGKVIIRVGSAEKKLRVEKAFTAAHAAVEAGIVPGGGIALFEAIPTLENLETENEAEALGVAIVRQALTAPLRTIVANAGEDHEAIIAAISDMQQRKRSLLDALRGPAQPKHFGYDVLTNKFVNMASAGIVDPAKVVCTALENAASTAMTILTSTST